MKIWRIVRERHLTQAWTPPELPHRWNSDRYRATYAALEPGTAVTEQLVYVKEVGQFGDRFLVEGAYTGSLEEAQDIPDGWDAWPHTPAVQRYGDAWLGGQGAGGLILPSTVIPAQNVMLNQDHPDFAVETVQTYALAGLTRL